MRGGGGLNAKAPIRQLSFGGGITHQLYMLELAQFGGDRQIWM